eukprot:m.340927 g.340927  ORF g.340927 m.340927 type:complete len:150 (+) comp55761_c0_seq88:2618-3067(+)
MGLPDALLTALSFGRSSVVEFHGDPRVSPKFRVLANMSASTIVAADVSFRNPWIDEVESETLPMHRATQMPAVPVPGNPTRAYKTLVLRAASGSLQFKIIIPLEEAFTDAGKAIGRACCSVYVGQGRDLELAWHAWLPFPGCKPHLKVE